MKRFIFAVAIAFICLSTAACSKKNDLEHNSLTVDANTSGQIDEIHPQVFDTPSVMIDWSSTVSEEDDSYIDTGLSEWINTFDDLSGTLDDILHTNAPPVESYGYTDYAGLEAWFIDLAGSLDATLQASDFAAAHFTSGTRLMTAITDTLHITYAIFNEGLTGDVWYSNNFYLTLANPNVKEKRQDNAAFIYLDGTLRHFVVFSDTGNVFWAISQDQTDSSDIVKLVEFFGIQLQ